MKKRKFLIFGFVIILVVILVDSTGGLKKAEGALVNILEPFGKFFSSSTNKSKGIFSKVSNIGNLQKENGELKSKVVELEAEIVKLEEFRKENEALKKDLGFKNTNSFKTMSAEIFLRDPSSTREMVFINKGEKEGIKKGMVVISQGVLVGKVIDTYDRSAKITLITDPTSIVPSLVSNSTASGIVKGQIGFGLALEKIPQGDIMKEGQMVFTLGSGGDYPKGILIGKIDKIDKNENEVFQKATIRPDINFNRLERVMVILE